jgi:hypothetical protein
MVASIICARWTWRTGKDRDLAHCSKVFRCSLVSTTGAATGIKGFLIIEDAFPYLLVTIYDALH